MILSILASQVPRITNVSYQYLTVFINVDRESCKRKKGGERETRRGGREERRENNVY
jgi:hypothetical protein